MDPNSNKILGNALTQLESGKALFGSFMNGEVSTIDGKKAYQKYVSGIEAQTKYQPTDLSESNIMKEKLGKLFDEAEQMKNELRIAELKNLDFMTPPAPQTNPKDKDGSKVQNKIDDFFGKSSDKALKPQTNPKDKDQVDKGSKVQNKIDDFLGKGGDKKKSPKKNNYFLKDLEQDNCLKKKADVTRPMTTATTKAREGMNKRALDDKNYTYKKNVAQPRPQTNAGHKGTGDNYGDKKPNLTKKATGENIGGKKETKATPKTIGTAKTTGNLKRGYERPWAISQMKLREQDERDKKDREEAGSDDVYEEPYPGQNYGDQGLNPYSHFVVGQSNCIDISAMPPGQKLQITGSPNNDNMYSNFIVGESNMVDISAIPPVQKKLGQDRLNIDNRYDNFCVAESKMVDISAMPHGQQQSYGNNLGGNPNNQYSAFVIGESNMMADSVMDPNLNKSPANNKYSAFVMGESNIMADSMMDPNLNKSPANNKYSAFVMGDSNVVNQNSVDLQNSHVPNLQVVAEEDEQSQSNEIKYSYGQRPNQPNQYLHQQNCPTLPTGGNKFGEFCVGESGLIDSDMNCSIPSNLLIQDSKFIASKINNDETKNQNHMCYTHTIPDPKYIQTTDQASMNISSKLMSKDGTNQNTMCYTHTIPDPKYIETTDQLSMNFQSQLMSNDGTNQNSQGYIHENVMKTTYLNKQDSGIKESNIISVVSDSMQYSGDTNQVNVIRPNDGYYDRTDKADSFGMLGFDAMRPNICSNMPANTKSNLVDFIGMKIEGKGNNSGPVINTEQFVSEYHPTMTGNTPNLNSIDNNAPVLEQTGNSLVDTNKKASKDLSFKKKTSKKNVIKKY